MTNYQLFHCGENFVEQLKKFMAAFPGGLIVCSRGAIKQLNRAAIKAGKGKCYPNPKVLQDRGLFGETFRCYEKPEDYKNDARHHLGVTGNGKRPKKD